MNKSEKHFAELANDIFESSDAFRKFLEAQPPDAVVGFARSRCNCPVANYSKSLGFPVDNATAGHLDIKVSATGRTSAVVGVNRHGYEDDGILSTEDAAWYSDFIHAVDRLNPQLAEITAQRALAILDAVESWIAHPDEITEEHVQQFSIVKYVLGNYPCTFHDIKVRFERLYGPVETLSLRYYLDELEDAGFLSSRLDDESQCRIWDEPDEPPIKHG